MRIRIAVLALVSVLGVAVPASAGQLKAQANSPVQKCTDSAQAAAACAEYRLAVSGALQLYYKEVNAGNLRHDYVTTLLNAAYSPSAKASILRWAIRKGRTVAEWPVGTNDVRGPSVKILWVVPSHPGCGRTLLVTRETWQITSSNNKVLYSETNQLHTILLGSKSVSAFGKLFKQVQFVRKGRDMKFAGC